MLYATPAYTWRAIGRAFMVPMENQEKLVDLFPCKIYAAASRKFMWMLLRVIRSFQAVTFFARVQFAK